MRSVDRRMGERVKRMRKMSEKNGSEVWVRSVVEKDGREGWATG